MKKSSIFIIIGFLLTVSLVFLYLALQKKNKPAVTRQTVREREQQINAIVQEKGAELSFTDTIQGVVGETISIPVMLDSGSFHIVGVDVNISFDPEAFSIVKVENGTIFDTLLSPNIDNKKGRVSFSLVMAPEKNGYNGPKTSIAVVIAKAKKESTSRLTYEFEKGERNDTNVSSTDLAGEDVLEKVTPATVIIR